MMLSFVAASFLSLLGAADFFQRRVLLQDPPEELGHDHGAASVCLCAEVREMYQLS